MKKTKLSLTLKSLMKTMNLTESELARKTGVCQPVIHRLASGETDNPKIASLRPIARYFDITIDQLVGDQPIYSDTLKVHIEQELYNIPLVTLDTIIEWHHNHQQNDNLENFVQTDIKISPHAFAIRLYDSTMYPMFPDGTVLIIEPNHEAKHKDYVIVAMDKQPTALFKQLLLDGPHRYLKSISTDYPLITMGSHDQIIGIMVQARIDFRQN